MTQFELMQILNKFNKTLFDIPIKRQKNYLQRLGVPKNDFDRSYKQYKCQNLFIPVWKVWVLNIISLCIFPFLFIYLLIKNEKRGTRTIVDCIGAYEGLEEIIPKELSSKYNIDSSVWMKGTYISHFDIKYITKIVINYPLSPYFALKLMIRIAQYSYMINFFNPTAIAVHHEYSYASSILTNYCNIHGVKHINVMHGEKLFHIVDAYFRYDECYVWNKYYKDLFISMKADESQFIIALPPSIKIDCQYYFQQKYYADFKYFLEEVTEKEMISIAETMKFAIDRGKTVKYRLHPRYSNPKIIEKIVGKSNIEDPFKVPILSSISSIEYAVGSYSTVLNQAFNSGKKVILDDITYKEIFLQLKDVNYYLTTVQCEKLSDYQ